VDQAGRRRRAVRRRGAALAIAFGRLPIGGKAFPAGGALGAGLARLLTEQLNRSGALVLVLTGLFLSLLMVTQLSFGTIAAAIGGYLRRSISTRVEAIGAWREERRREKQRQEVIRKHLEKGTSPETVEKAVTKADAARAADGRRPALTMPGATGKTATTAKAANLDDEDDDDLAEGGLRPRARGPPTRRPPPRPPRRRPRRRCRR
jgi:hypothetical protein